MHAVPSGSPLVYPSRQIPNSTYLHLEWDPPSKRKRNGIITHYTLEIIGGQDHNTNTTQLTVEDLHPYTVYQYRVAAHTSVGIGPFTGNYSIRTLQDGECP